MSCTFAAPFFFLALFPALLRTLPKSGSWLNSVKVVMGFLELAAALKFFRSAELVLTSGTPSFFTFDLVLGVWIAMSLLCGLYLIGIFRAGSALAAAQGRFTHVYVERTTQCPVAIPPAIREALSRLIP